VFAHGDEQPQGLEVDVAHGRFEGVAAVVWIVDF
jgi:hypothetical protein